MLLNLSKTREIDAWRYDAKIHTESQFRSPGVISESDNLARRVVVSRWRGCSPSPQVHRAEISDEYHTIGICMVRSQLRLTVSGNFIYEGAVEAGSIQLCSPGQSIELQTNGVYDWIHVHVGKSVLQCCQAMLQPCARSGSLDTVQEMLFRDLVVVDLINGLVKMSSAYSPISLLCAESIILAIVTRVLAKHPQGASSESAPRVNALIAWRLKRVKQFVADHLGGPIALADMGQAAGLTRMHFARQFRAATGLRPHEYVLQQRIQRAKELLLSSDMKLLDIALAVGFQTQAHFTTVFRRIALGTPHQWRCRERALNAPQHIPVVVRQGFHGRNISAAFKPAELMLNF
jgi:AraC family transcriptional regulator